jgi:ABC-type polysaccharide/polyol phosphate export permease
LPESWVVCSAAGVRREGRREWLATLATLIRHEFRIRYRAQALGAAWSFLHPIVMMAVLSVVLPPAFGATDGRYSVYLLIGLVFWNFWSTSITASVGSLVAKAAILRHTMLPRPLVPLSVMLSYALNLGVEILALVAFVPVYPRAFRLSPALALVPVALVFLVALMGGVVLVGSVLNVVYRDVGYLVTTALLLLFWLTPIVYPLGAVREPFRSLLAWNPLTAILETLRGAVMDGAVPDARTWATMTVAAFASLAIGWLVFHRFERVVLDHV